MAVTLRSVRAPVTFETVGTKTRITMYSRFPTVEARDHAVRACKAIEGGQQTLGRLAGFLERKP